MQKVTRARGRTAGRPEGAGGRGGLRRAGARVRGASSTNVPAALAADRAAAAAPAGRAEGGRRAAGADPGGEQALHLIPRSVTAAREAWSRVRGRRRGAREAAGRHAAPRAALCRRPRTAAPASARLRRVAAQLPRAGVLPDGGHGGAAAHPGALLHHAVGQAGARVGDLVDAVHPAALRHRAGAGGAGEVRGLQRPRRHAVRPACRPGSRTGRAADPALLSVVDINHDGILQLGEMRIGSDIVVLATPEIAGLPYVVSAMVAAGALAAALSTADGLLLTIGNALSHDTYYKMIDPNASASRRVTARKCCCWRWRCRRPAWPRSGRPTSCSWCRRRSRSLPRRSFRRSSWACSGSAPTSGAPCAAWSPGSALTCYYMGVTQPWLRGVLGVSSPRRAVVGHPADLGRRVRRAARLRGDRRREPAHAGADRGAAGRWPSRCATRAWIRRRSRLRPADRAIICGFPCHTR